MSPKHHQQLMSAQYSLRLRLDRAINHSLDKDVQYTDQKKISDLVIFLVLIKHWWSGPAGEYCSS